jgi:hypothetical protein
MKINSGTILICAAALLCSAAHGTTILSIQPAVVPAIAGDTGDSFDVVLTNSGPSSISVAAFSFEVSVTDPDITLTSADFSTALPYIFAGDSFDATNGFPLNTTSGQTLDASDLTNDGAGITVAAGQSFGLGHVLFDVAPNANPGAFPLTFTGGAGANNLSDPNGNNIPIDAFTSAVIVITSPVAAVPEPSYFLPLLAGLAVLAYMRKRAGAHPAV